MTSRLTWTQRVANLTAALNRPPTLEELLLLASMYNMTEDEIEAQRQSWARANRRTGDPRWD